MSCAEHSHKRWTETLGQRSDVILLLPMLFIIGREGYVAQRLIKKLRTYGIDFLTTGCSLSDEGIYLDLQKVNEFDFSVTNAGDTVLFLAAISSPTICKEDYDIAYRINVTGTLEAIQRFIERGARVVFFSSDVVYGNSKEQVDENSFINPVGEYGRMKHEVEKMFLGEQKVKIFRLSYVFSWNDRFMLYLHDCSEKQAEAVEQQSKQHDWPHAKT